MKELTDKIDEGYKKIFTEFKEPVEFITPTYYKILNPKRVYLKSNCQNSKSHIYNIKGKRILNFEKDTDNLELRERAEFPLPVRKTGKIFKIYNLQKRIKTDESKDSEVKPFTIVHFDKKSEIGSTFQENTSTRCRTGF